MFRKWIYAVGEGGLSLTSGVPVFQELYLCYMRNGKASNIGRHPAMQTGARLLSKGLHAKVEPVSVMARVTFFEAWDVTPDEQVAIEKHFKSLVLAYNVRAIDSDCEYQSTVL